MVATPTIFWTSVFSRLSNRPVLVVNYCRPGRERVKRAMEVPTNQNVRILIAEDHPSLGRSMAEGLREEGYNVDLAVDGNIAEQELSEKDYSCLILDLILP